MLSELLRRWQLRRAEARAIAELRGFNRHELADLGISRDQIRAYVTGKTG